MRLAIITDTHFGARNENGALLQSTINFFSDIFFPYLDDSEIDTVLHLGDLVDRRRSINFLILNNLRNSFIDPLVEREIQTHIVVGNHDMYYKNTNQVNSVNELYGTTDIIHVYDSITDVEFDGLKVCLVPWICPENEADTFIHLNRTDAQVVMGHLELKGFTMHSGMVCEHGYGVEDFSKFDQVFSGHFHHKNGNGHVEYLGAPYELTWSDYDSPRGFHIYDTDTRELEFIQNPVPNFVRLEYSELATTDFDLKDKFVKVIVKNKDNPYHFEKYMSEVNQSAPYVVRIIEERLDFSDTTEMVDEAQDTMTILGKYVDDMDTGLDKSKLKVLLGELYTESMEII